MINLPILEYSEADIEASNAPEGYSPITSHSEYACAAGPIFERTFIDGNQEKWERGFRVMPKHTNAGGMAHGGLLMTFADILLATAVFREVPPPFVTVRMTNDFMGAAKMGAWVTGTAKVTKRTGSLVFVEGEMCVESAPIFRTSGIFKHRAGRK